MICVKGGRPHLDAVRVVVQQQDSETRHFLGLHHGFHVCQEVHVFGHVCGEHLGSQQEFDTHPPSEATLVCM